MPKNLSLVDLKIDEIIGILLLHPEVEAPPENYRELGEHLVKFKLQNSQDSLEDIFSMVSTFEVNRGRSEEFLALEDDEPWDEEDIDESGGEPDNEEFWDEEPEETSGAYSDDESFFNEFSLLSAVEYRVFLGLVMKISKEVGGFVEFLTMMQDTLIRLEFSTPQVMEVMSEHLNPNCSRFYSTGIKSMLEQAFSVNYENN
jgi:hypothetical protein